MIIEILGSLAVSAVDTATLASGWRSAKDYSICQAVGNEWYDKGTTPILKVPSAILTTDFNFVINSTHADYAKIKLLATTDLVPDERIEDLLKKYPVKP
jgi:RES domain-containing protein